MNSPKLEFGTYDDALKMVGYSTETRFADVPIEMGLARTFSAMVEDRNASYWNKEFAESFWGHAVAPPALISCMFMPQPWPAEGMEKKVVLGVLVPLPGSTVINVSDEVRYFRPLQIGDWLNVTETVTAVSPEKSTRLGTGHFVTTTALYREGTGQPIAEAISTMFRYEPHPQSDQNDA